MPTAGKSFTSTVTSICTLLKLGGFLTWIKPPSASAAASSPASSAPLHPRHRCRQRRSKGLQAAQAPQHHHHRLLRHRRRPPSHHRPHSHRQELAKP
ncbi:unnamed protein product [Linum tenue]|uniref:Uncharacterized protein n=1 Tax=Linum tenue TaxID=586396 RepID=A0AAV0Q1R0_9ROSI|nr:unnamed protein product [Linum tenue]